MNGEWMIGDSMNGEWMTAKKMTGQLMTQGMNVLGMDDQGT